MFIDYLINMFTDQGMEWFMILRSNHDDEQRVEEREAWRVWTCQLRDDDEN